MSLKRITTVNNIDMIQCGDYNWKILLEHDGSEVYQLSMNNNKNGGVMLLYGEGNFTVRSNNDFFGHRGSFFIFKIPFEETPALVKALLEGEGCTLYPIAHKDTVILKE